MKHISAKATDIAFEASILADALEMATYAAHNTTSDDAAIFHKTRSALIVMQAYLDKHEKTCAELEAAIFERERDLRAFTKKLPEELAAEFADLIAKGDHT